MTAETVTVTFRDQPVAVSVAAVREAVQMADTSAAVRRVLPTRDERQAIGLVTLGDALAFLQALDRALQDAPYALPLRVPGRRAPRPSQHRRGPRITR